MCSFKADPCESIKAAAAGEKWRRSDPGLTDLSGCFKVLNQLATAAEQLCFAAGVKVEQFFALSVWMWFMSWCTACAPKLFSLSITTCSPACHFTEAGRSAIPRERVCLWGCQQWWMGSPRVRCCLEMLLSSEWCWAGTSNLMDGAVCHCRGGVCSSSWWRLQAISGCFSVPFLGSFLCCAWDALGSVLFSNLASPCYWGLVKHCRTALEMKTCLPLLLSDLSPDGNCHLTPKRLLLPVPCKWILAPTWIPHPGENLGSICWCWHIKWFMSTKTALWEASTQLLISPVPLWLENKLNLRFSTLATNV